MGRHHRAFRYQPEPIVTPPSKSQVKRARTVGGALMLALFSTVLPGSGHLVLRRRVGFVFLGFFLLLIGAGAYLALTTSTDDLLGYVASSEFLLYVMGGLAVVAVAWITIVVSAYLAAVPRRTATGQRLVGGALVTVLCLGVATPFGYAAYNLDAHRNLLDTVFPSGSAGSGAQAGADVKGFRKPRINVLLIGSDAGHDRIGTRTDTMMTASIDTKTGRTTLFALPRNTQNALFPPGSKLAKQFPNGFTDPRSPNSSEYLLNAMYKYGNEHPDLVPPGGPSKIPGLNLLWSSISTMLGLELDYYVQVNMEGFASIIDALGGLDVNVGPHRVPMGGIGPFGEPVKPFGYIEPGRQHLTGDQALWFARSRTNTDDYTRMGRQRCLIKYVVEQNPPSKILNNFRSVAEATSANVSTNIPQDVLPALLQLAMKIKEQPLESISFDPNLPNPRARDGKFDTARPDYAFMRQVVQSAISPPPNPHAAPAPGTTTTAPTTTPSKAGGKTTTGKPTSPANPSSAPATSLNDACAA
ncbi:cell envelope-related function transcriptional attenuator common domain-containing protein [Allokutzneria albata]|uniref:Cell envelope-related function transcriptional attenuator common domain-containing protein n=1 Tax=Allokutzneria albata TaxID=211114 RepID=A0A1H0CDJ3_ALLAB|nr:cell envelope-related function transcriptional attenuator common domain-containing protein [Allokutzneria albata]